MSRRSAVLTAAAWVLVVSLGATAVWSVISRAGAGVAGELPVPSATVEAPGGTPTASVPDPGPEGGPVTRSWRGSAGTVTASCAGPVVTLVRAQPASGWRVEVDDAGPDLVRVELETADERTRVRVESVCRDGVPVFTDEERTKG